MYALVNRFIQFLPFGFVTSQCNTPVWKFQEVANVPLVRGSFIESLVIVIVLVFRFLLCLLLRLLAVVDPVLVTVVRLILALLLARDRSSTSFDVLVDLVVNLRLAVGISVISSGVEEGARVCDVFLDDTEFSLGDGSRLVLPGEDARLDDLVSMALVLHTRDEGRIWKDWRRTSEITWL